MGGTLRGAGEKALWFLDGVFSSLGMGVGVAILGRLVSYREVAMVMAAFVEGADRVAREQYCT